MATASPLPISMREYLHNRYEPDRDYVDGIVEARNVGTPQHDDLQKALVNFIGKQPWGVRADPDVRIQTSASHVRVADVALLPAERERPQVVEDPPIVVIEILSPEDRVPRHAERVADYQRMGIENIWMIDSTAHKGFDCSQKNWAECERFAVPDTPIRLDLPAFFASTEGKAR